MKDRVNMIYPEYVENFKCIGGACEDNCCIGWDIDVDKITFKKYFKVKDEEMKKLFQKNVHNNSECTNEALDYGRIKLNKEKRCPFLNKDNYCKVQGKCGEDYLSSVCTQFPRVLNKVDDHYEMVLDLSCPEAARIVLDNTKKIKFKKENKSLGKFTMSGVLETASKEFRGTPIKYFKEIRDFSIKIIQYRKLDLSKRLYVLGDLLSILEEISEEDADRIPVILSKYNIDETAEYYERNDMSYTFQVSFFKNVVDSLNIIEEIDSDKFREMTKKTLAGFDIKKDEDVIENAAYYINAFKNYTEEFIDINSHIFENYFVNFIYNNLFPFSESDYMFEGYIMLLFRYSLMRFYLVGMYLYNKSESKDGIIDFIQVFVKSFEHDRNYRSEILEYIQENGFDNMEFANMIL